MSTFSTVRRALLATALGCGAAQAADTVFTMPDRQARPGVAIEVFGAAGNGDHGDGSANGETYTWSFAANPDVVVNTDGNLAGAVAADRFIAETVSFQLINGSTREIVQATLTVDDGAGGVSQSTVAIDVVSNADEISDTALEALAVDVNIAIEDGLRAMYLQQLADGRWGWRGGATEPSRDCGTTGFSLWAFANRGYGPLSDSIYARTARRGVDHILSNTQAIDPPLQPHIGDPDADQNGRALNLCPTIVEGYAHPIAIAALIAAYSDAPQTVLDFSPFAGETVFQLVQDGVDFIAYAQSDQNNVTRGGWRYRANQGADTSADSWNYLALEGFEAVFGGAVLESVKVEAERRIFASQAGNGSFGYTSANQNLGTAHARTAGGISGLLMVSAGGRATPILGGSVPGRLTTAIGWIGQRWSANPGVWAGNRGNFYAMWTTARAFRLAGVDEIPGGLDWETGEVGGNGTTSQFGYFPYLLNLQQNGGHWNPTVNGNAWTRNLNTAWAVLVLTPTVFGPPNSAPMCVAQDVATPVDDACDWSITAADVDGGSSDPDGDALNYSVDPSAGNGLEPTDVTLTVDDGNGQSDSCGAVVTPFDPIPPTLECDASGPYECVAECGADVALSSQATDNCPGDLPVTDDSGACFGLGTTTVTFNTADASGNTAECTADVEVVDTTAPVITVGTASTLIWPPNHKCNDYDLIADCGVSWVDACDSDNSDTAVAITHITSDEPFEVGAGGDGAHADDIEITGATTFKLRAERQGGANGRFYTVHFEVTDGSGNVAADSCQFVVPHDRSPRHLPVDDGPAETCGADDDCVCAPNPVAQGRAKGKR